jgi:hypothetical protein
VSVALAFGCALGMAALFLIFAMAEMRRVTA